ncbi:hypothetical protein RB614_05625 [Phytohabitans sp. ZYX-F-186]|uniref:Uncharacterized protein n=1 Tax=Phytohabitans maris TaxID=3071409 RepID=A0ABU0ZAE2_9ACTN|nr:hypothetical protein [Phytohabitans sp. ZYX-F-186]MDQ7904000.1 hypothetical protein [Phytohabitans sp. ZYX-F-186]
MVTWDGWEPWRTEADDQWLAAHSSDAFSRIRRVFHPLAGGADAVSHSVLGGMFGGAPRNPQLKVKGVTPEQVRYAERHYAYTTSHVDVGLCRRCGHPLEERHHLLYVDPHGHRQRVGTARACRRCAARSWLFTSHMPGARRLAAARAKIAL